MVEITGTSVFHLHHLLCALADRVEKRCRFPALHWLYRGHDSGDVVQWQCPTPRSLKAACSMPYIGYEIYRGRPTGTLGC